MILPNRFRHDRHMFSITTDPSGPGLKLVPGEAATHGGL